MWQAIDDQKLAAALAEQSVTAKPLGSVLLARGWIDEETLADAISFQSNLSRAAPTMAAFTRHAAALPLEVCRRLGVLVIDEAGGRPVVAVPKPIAGEDLAELRRLLGKEPLQQVAIEEEIAAGLEYIATVQATGRRSAAA